MGTHEPDVQSAPAKMNHSYQPVFIAANIEYKPVITHGIHAVKAFPNVRKAAPITILTG